MSLAAELDKKDSPVRRWFDERVANVKPIADAWNAAVKTAPLIRPLSGERPPGTASVAPVIRRPDRPPRLGTWSDRTFGRERRSVSGMFVEPYWPRLSARSDGRGRAAPID